MLLNIHFIDMIIEMLLMMMCVVEMMAKGRMYGEEEHDLVPFFEDMQNVYCLAIGLGIIGTSLIMSIFIYRYKRDKRV